MLPGPWSSVTRHVGLVAYTLMSLGAFTVLMVVTRREGPLYAFDDYAGLGTTAYGFLASRA